MTESLNRPAPRTLPLHRMSDLSASFWELEGLIASGLERDEALFVMAIRRGEMAATFAIAPNAGPRRQGHGLLART
jgi:hypothetical protein